MVTLWNTLFKFTNIHGEKPLLELIKKTEREGKVRISCSESGSYNQKSEYVSSQANVLHTWRALLILTAVFVIIAIIMLEFIDKQALTGIRVRSLEPTITGFSKQGLSVSL